ncbi:unnamed protein product [Knipowitschia caucasica]|uniref:Interleukin-18 n=1 Tax=Knipowitschia caucasica TaxID=637954 RepID=A0AAV2J388_KNICA
MASSDGALLTFLDLKDNHFYFDDLCGEDELDSDAFKWSMASPKLVRSPDNKFLILNEENQFDLKDLNIQQQSCSNYKCYINIYKDLSQQSICGRAVMLYVLKDDRKYAAVCKNEKEISAEEIALQDRIEASQHKALFYMVQNQQPHRYQFRSSLYPNKVIGFDEADSTKLILCPYDPEDQCDTFHIK